LFFLCRLRHNILDSVLKFSGTSIALHLDEMDTDAAVIKQKE
jgi:hypothetical protein